MSVLEVFVPCPSMLWPILHCLLSASVTISLDYGRSFSHLSGYCDPSLWVFRSVGYSFSKNETYDQNTRR